jgi:hypothetical protein
MIVTAGRSISGNSSCCMPRGVYAEESDSTRCEKHNGLAVQGEAGEAAKHTRRSSVLREGRLGARAGWI